MPSEMMMSITSPTLIVSSNQKSVWLVVPCILTDAAIGKNSGSQRNSTVFRPIAPPCTCVTHAVSDRFCFVSTPQRANLNFLHQNHLPKIYFIFHSAFLNPANAAKPQLPSTHLHGTWDEAVFRYGLLANC